MTDLIEPAEHPRNYDPPGWSNADAFKARDAEIERLRAALALVMGYPGIREYIGNQVCTAIDAAMKEQE